MFLIAKQFDLVWPGYLSDANVLGNLWLSWYHFLRKGKGGSQPSTAPPVCYKAVESSEEKDAMKGRSGYSDVFCKKGALKNFPIYIG